MTDVTDVIDVMDVTDVTCLFFFKVLLEFQSLRFIMCEASSAFHLVAH